MAKNRGCLGEGIKAAILSEFPELQVKLEEIPNCELADDIVLGSGGGSSGSGKSKGKREPSAYNNFTGACMKDNHTMKECAVLWKEQKSQ
jgi:hypothetical protein